MVYLSTSQQIFQEQYQLAELFPYIFASLAISVGLATFLNSRLVVKYGMMRMSYLACIRHRHATSWAYCRHWSGN